MSKTSDHLLDDQRERWERGDRRPVEDYLSENPALAGDPEGTLDLIYQEFVLASAVGPAPSDKEYFQRFPQFRDALETQLNLLRTLESLANKVTMLRGKAASTFDGQGNVFSGESAGQNSLSRLDDPSYRGQADGWPNLSGFHFLKELGRGAMGIVHKAKQASLGRVVAIKMIHPFRLGDAEARARFRKEAESAASLHHPNIVQIYDKGEQNDTPFIVMEYVNGPSLEEILEAGPLPADQAAQITETLANALEHAHSRGVIHRDLKPANILVSLPGSRSTSDRSIGPDEPNTNDWESASPWNSGAFKISDFGLARRLDDEAKTITRDGAFLGTPAYMAPEQADGKGRLTDSKTDIYALGAILYQMLTGRPPLVAATPLETLAAIASEREPVKPTRVTQNVPRDLETICLECLQKEPDRRYPSASALAADLRLFLEGRPIHARPPGLAVRATKAVKRHPLTTVLLTSIALLLIGIGLTAFWQSSYEEATRVQLDQYKVDVQKSIKKNAELGDRLEKVEQENGFGALQQAQSAIAQGNLVGALRTLADVPKRLRGMEWWHLRRAFDGSLFALVGHEETVTRVLFTPDGNNLVSCSKDKTVRIWDVRTGLEQRVLHGHTDRILGLAISPDGRLIASSGADSTVRIWETQTGRQRLCLAGSGAIIDCVAFSPDGRLVACGDREGKLRIWRANDGHEIRVVTASKADIGDLAFSPNGRWIATGHDDWSINLWDVQTGNAIKTMHIHPAKAPTTPRSVVRIRLAFMPESRRLLAATLPASEHLLWDLEQGIAVGDAVEENHFSFGQVMAPFALSPDCSQICAIDRRLIRAQNLISKKVLWSLPGHSLGDIWDLAWSPDGNLLASASSDHTIRVWDIQRHQLSGRLVMHTEPGTVCARFSRDGKRFLTVNGGGIIRLWNAQTGVSSLEVRLPGENVNCADFCPDGRSFVAIGDHIAVWDSMNGREIAHGPQYRSVARCLAFSPDGEWLASGHCDHSVRLWHPKSGALRVLDGGVGSVTSIAFREDGLELAVAGEESPIMTWDLRTYQESALLRYFNHTAPLGKAISYRPGFRQLAIGFDTSTYLWTPTSPRPELDFVAHVDHVTAVAWRANGNQLVSATEGGEIRSWQAETGQCLMHLRGSPNGQFGCMDVSRADGSILNCGADGTINLWYGSMELPLVEMEAGQQEVHCIALSGNGQRIASGGENKTIRLWDCSTGDLLQTWQFDHPIMNVRFQGDSPVDCTDSAELGDPEAKKEAITRRRNTTIRTDDSRVSAQFTQQAIRVFRPPSEQELAYRRWVTRPDPFWHAEQREKFEKMQDWHAAHLQRIAEERARAVVAFDEGKMDQSFWHFVAAAALHASKPR